jgi:hypothetical protein
LAGWLYTIEISFTSGVAIETLDQKGQVFVRQAHRTSVWTQRAW